MGTLGIGIIPRKSYFQESWIEHPRSLPVVISEDDPRVPISLDRFPEHVASMRANGGINYSEQYSMISRELNQQFSHSREQDNVMKNRYHNIPSYDDTRVCLEYIDDDIHSDYINANFINGTLFLVSPRKV